MGGLKSPCSWKANSFEQEVGRHVAERACGAQIAPYQMCIWKSLEPCSASSNTRLPSLAALASFLPPFLPQLEKTTQGSLHQWRASGTDGVSAHGGDDARPLGSAGVAPVPQLGRQGIGLRSMWFSIYCVFVVYKEGGVMLGT